MLIIDWWEVNNEDDCSPHDCFDSGIPMNASTRRMFEAGYVYRR